MTFMTITHTDTMAAEWTNIHNKLSCRRGCTMLHVVENYAMSNSFEITPLSKVCTRSYQSSTATMSIFTIPDTFNVE